MAWIFLIVAIIFEVAGTMSLRAAVNGSKLWFIAVAVAYVIAFAGITLVLSEGLALGVAYGIWAASGVALTAVFSKLIFKEPLTVLMAAGIALIFGGVLLVEIGASH